MTKQVQRRRGTDTQHTSFTGAEGEISVNTTNKSIHVHDGATAGGIEAARADLGNVSDADLNSALTGNTLSSLTVTSADINGGTIDGTVIGGSTPAAGSFTTGSFTGNVSFGDNDKAIFGAGSDLQIYHDGSNSRIDDAGEGSLTIRGNDVWLGQYTGKWFLHGTPNAQVDLYYDNSIKLATTSTGIDVTGTVTADGLTVNSGTTDTAALFQSSDSQSYIAWEDNTTATPIRAGVFGDNFIIGTSSAERMRIDSSGRLLQGVTSNTVRVNSSGTNAVPEVILSRNSVGTNLDTEPPVLTLLNDSSTLTANRMARMSFAAISNNLSLPIHSADIAAVFTSGASGNGVSSNLVFRTTDNTAVQEPEEAMRIDSSGNVGIGTTSPRAPLHLHPSGAASDDFNILVSQFRPNIVLEDLSTSATDFQLFVEGNYLQFRYGDASTDTKLANEAMRIDSSGNLLVGTTNTSPATNNVDGAVLRNEGHINVSRSSGVVGYFNRRTLDGTILDFRKDGAPVGSIVVSNALGIGSSAVSDAYLRFYNSFVTPADASNANRDAAVTLGSSSARFKDIYATNGTIQTSDRNEKQDIEALSDAEQRVAVACKGLMRKFRWKDAVAEKGDDARIHFGIIAQDLQDAFAAEGLDAGDYAMFISSTWTDEETGEERTRMGVRYSELLAFIIAAI